MASFPLLNKMKLLYNTELKVKWISILKFRCKISNYRNNWRSNIRVQLAKQNLAGLLFSSESKY